MNLTESIRVALRAIGANKLRASLTMLGMIIGVGAVIALMSIGKGVQASVTSQIKGLGTNLLFISPGATQQGGVRTQAGSAPTLTDEDAQAIAEAIPQVVAVAPEAVNGANTRQTLFGDGEPLGQTIRVNNVNLRVVGVMESKGAQAQGNQDDIV